MKVDHILEYGKLFPHKLTKGVVVTEEKAVIYPPPPKELNHFFGDTAGFHE